ncbi:cytochrome b-245 light chain-like [Branchiostoma floridae]|uniref:Cytochrome b-245 light chain n=1 Tax=Branchiostoma floridae TaxID=7739 RepID=C3YFI0_BRAFL|nr:cytochrome b-245 light chain-like [Branchiostoma floridae]XP_035679502.1 cytochrome b-245 light chain-like [Branchiostoma floridae]|eukprot:XP_002604933.1 hypothetical protein BRAFLDRAFT_58490 [Branchiostoma floridae]
MGQIEWAMWANEQAIISAWVMLTGGIIGLTGFNRWEIAAYSVAAGIFIILLEYPRGKRKKGHTIERRYQQYLTRVIHACGTITSNYYIRFVLHLLLCVPAGFQLPTILGALGLFIASIIYFVAAFHGEKWQPIGIDTKGAPSSSNQTVITQPPSQPPPRAPAHVRPKRPAQPVEGDPTIL